MNTDTRHTVRLELAEARAWSELYDTAPDIRSRLRIDCRRIGTATAVMAGAVDILALNRVTAMGLDGPVGEDVIDTVIAAYAAAGVPRFFVQVPPDAHPGLTATLERRGFTRYNEWVKLSRGVRPHAGSRCDLRVEAIDGRRAGEFADVFVSGFEWPRRLAPWLAALVGRPGWRHYLATDNGRGVATAAMRVDGDTAWIDFASTLPSRRGQGAQSALLERRVRDAAEAGVRTLVVEAGDGSASMRNLLRAGFRVEYRRANYLKVLE